MSDNTSSRERLEAPPGAVYTETILEPSYRFMLEHYFQPLVETNKAWMVMLAETEIVIRETAAALLDAILDLDGSTCRTSSFASAAPSSTSPSARSRR